MPLREVYEFNVSLEKNKKIKNGKKREIMDGADRRRLERLRAAGYDVEKYKEYIDE